jgi:hypothetical protein
VLYSKSLVTVLSGAGLILSFNSIDPNISLLMGSDGQRVLDLLASLDTLKEVSLINNEGCPHDFENGIPPFRNLSKLELLRMDYEYEDREIEVAKILISCPHMRELALSTVGWTSEDDIDLLPKLVQHYRSKTNKRLKLRSLRLGYGFLPVRSPLGYLSDLTDTTLLEILRLDNENISTGNVMTDAPIDVKQFVSANNVKSFTAERLSPDIVELIHQLNSSGHLTTLSLPRYCDTQPRARMDEDDEYWWDDWYGEDTPGPPTWDPAQMFSEPLEQAGSHRKNISIGDIFRTEHLNDHILNCITTYSRVEVLTLSLPVWSWLQFRDEIMPGLRHLQQLFLVGDKNVGSYGYQGEVFQWGQTMGKTQEEVDEMAKQQDKDYADHQVTFARDVFYANRSRIARGDDCAVLKYLGLGSSVFTCMLLPATASCGLLPFSIEKDGGSWLYHIILLDSDEATAFGSVCEYNEEIAELRVGGDQDTPIWCC